MFNSNKHTINMLRLPITLLRMYVYWSRTLLGVERAIAGSCGVADIRHEKIAKINLVKNSKNDHLSRIGQYVVQWLFKHPIQ